MTTPRPAPPGHKRCPRCEQVKPLGEFHRNPTRRDGHNEMCGACKTVAVKAAQARRRAAIGEEAWAAENRARVYRSRARKLDAPPDP